MIGALTLSNTSTSFITSSLLLNNLAPAFVYASSTNWACEPAPDWTTTDLIPFLRRSATFAGVIATLRSPGNCSVITPMVSSEKGMLLDVLDVLLSVLELGFGGVAMVDKDQ